MYLKKLFVLALTVMLSSGVLLAQSTTLTLQESSELRLDGDSNVKSWGADAETMSGTLVLSGIDEITLENLAPEHFESLAFSVEVEGLESGSGGLNKNMYKYLKGDDYPNITFELTEITGIEHDNGSAVITATGVINAAGVDNQVNMTVNATVNEDGSITFSGEQDLLMTSFDIDPPTAVFGTIRSRDEMNITFNTTFSR